jgi:hypothetical protein
MSRFASFFNRASRACVARPRYSRSFRASLEPVEDRLLMTSITAVSWNSGGVEHAEVFTLGVDNTVWADKDSAGLVPLGGYLESISAGLDAAGNPEVYGIGGNNAVWVNHVDGRGWSSLGGNVTAISASSDNTVYAIAPNNLVYVDFGLGWYSQGGYSTQISASTTGSGLPEVFAIGSSNSVYVDVLGQSGWTDLGGSYSSLSASTNGAIFAIGANNTVSADTGSGFYYLGGYLKQIAAGTDQYGRTEVYGIGGDNAIWVNHLNGSGWSSQGGSVVEIAATSYNIAFARGGDVSDIFGDTGGVLYSEGVMPLTEPQSTVGYWAAPTGVGLYSPSNGNQPSYLDVDQGQVGDCWLMASLAEVADRDPQLIKNMFVYEGIGLDGGFSVAYYSVRFYTPTGISFAVDVDTNLPFGGAYYSKVTNDLGTSALWPALAEKAYAEANALGYVNTGSEDNGTYASLNSYYPTAALQAITNLPVSYISTNNLTTPLLLAEAWYAGDFIVLATNSPSSSYVVSNHAYAMVGYNSSSSQPFQMFNPWGTDSSGWAPGLSGVKYGLFYANSGFITSNFTGTNVAVVASKVNNVAGTVEVPNEPILLAQGDPTADGSLAGLALGEEISGAATWFEDVRLVLQAEPGKGHVHGRHDRGNPEELAESHPLSRVIFLKAEQALQFATDLIPAPVLVTARDRVGEDRQGHRAESAE